MAGFARVVLVTALASIASGAAAQELPPEPEVIDEPLLPAEPGTPGTPGLPGEPEVGGEPSSEEGEELPPEPPEPPEPEVTVDAPPLPSDDAEGAEADGSENSAPSLVDRDDEGGGLSLLVSKGASVIAPLPAPDKRAVDAEGDALGWRFADGEGSGETLNFDGGRASLTESSTGWRLSVFADVDAPDVATLRLRAFETGTEEMLATDGTWDVALSLEAADPDAASENTLEPSTSPDGRDAGEPPAPEAPGEGEGPEPVDVPEAGDGEEDMEVPDATGSEPEPVGAMSGPDEGTVPSLETADPEEGAARPDTSDEPLPEESDPGDGGNDGGPAASPEAETEAPSGEAIGGAPGLRLVATSDRVIVLEWDAVSDSFFTLERDGVPVALAGERRFVDTEVVAGDSYRYALVLDGEDDRTVVASLSAVATISEPGPDRTSPLAPGEVLALRREDGTTIVAWQAAGDDRGVDGYDVYRDGRYVVTVFSAGWIDPEGPDAVGTVYEVAAFDAARNYSHRSVATFVDGQAPSVPADTTPVSVTRDEMGRFSFAPVNRSESAIVLVGSDMVTSVWPPADLADATGFRASDPTVEVYVLPAFGEEGEAVALRLELTSEGSPSSTVVFDPSAALSPK